MTKYDLVVIGAGIHGAGVAQAAAAAGLSVLVVERREQAGLETSSRSSKLVHGGLRYLETGQFKLVYECLRERRRLLKNAPSKVKLQRFYIPVYRHSQRKSWWIMLGLMFYSVLGGLRRECRFRRVPKHQWSALGIRLDGLQAVLQYCDAQTDDAALTQAVLRSAQSYGAEVRLNTAVVRAQHRSLYDICLSDHTEVQSTAIVNAAGPWVNQAAAAVDGAPQAEIDWVQGAHIVLDIPSFDGCFYLEAPDDGRAVFVLPWRGLTMVGTTEHLLSGPMAKISDLEIDYLLRTFNFYFERFDCTRSHITEAFAGARVLPRGDRQEAAHRRPRETLLLTDDTRSYVAIYGGKLTSYRATAEKALRLVLSGLKRDASNADFSARIPLD